MMIHVSAKSKCNCVFNFSANVEIGTQFCTLGTCVIQRKKPKLSEPKHSPHKEEIERERETCENKGVGTSTSDSYGLGVLQAGAESGLPHGLR